MKKVLIAGLLTLNIWMTGFAEHVDDAQLHTFHAGDPARASDVNENFDALQEAVNDNDLRIDTLQSTLGAIDIANVVGDVGIEYQTFTDYQTIHNPGDENMYSLGSIGLECPTDGYALVIFNGYCWFGGDQRTVDIGIGMSALSFITSMQIGRAHGTSTNRTSQAFTVVAVQPVGPGKRAFFALAQGNAVFDSNWVNVVPKTMAAVFIPKRY
jgi:hypothetical protein